MENESKIIHNKDLLSQSSSEGLERFLKPRPDFFPNYQLPPKVLRTREIFWDNLFKRYSQELSDVTEYDLTKPKIVKVASDNDTESTRVPMTKPNNLIQYWIDTGDSPYRLLLDDNNDNVSQTCSKTEHLLKETIHSKSAETIRNYNRRIQCDSSSCSSVDTAAYILSNANITRKSGATAKVENIKHKKMGSLQAKPVVETTGAPVENSCVLAKDKYLHEQTVCSPVKTVLEAERETIFNNNTKICDNDAGVSLAKDKSEITNDKAPAENVHLGNNIDSSAANMLHNTILTPHSIDSENNSNVPLASQNISLKESMEKALRCLTNNSLITPSQSEHESVTSNDNDDVFEIFDQGIFGSDKSKTQMRRKKLYSGRDSPVDLIGAKSSGKIRLSQANEAEQTLHPALQPGIARWKSKLIKRNILAKKRKRWSSLFTKHLLNNTINLDKTRKDNNLDTKNEESLSVSSGRDTVTTNADVSSTDVTSSTNISLKKNPTKKKKPLQANIYNRRKQGLNRSVKLTKAKLVKTPKATSKRNLYPVVVLNRLSESTVNRYKDDKIQVDKKNINPIVLLKRLSNVEIQKYISKKSESGKQMGNKNNKNAVYDVESDGSGLLICECPYMERAFSESSLKTNRSSVKTFHSRNAMSSLSQDAAVMQLRRSPRKYMTSRGVQSQPSLLMLEKSPNKQIKNISPDFAANKNLTTNKILNNKQSDQNDEISVPNKWQTSLDTQNYNDLDHKSRSDLTESPVYSVMQNTVLKTINGDFKNVAKTTVLPGSHSPTENSQSVEKRLRLRPVIVSSDEDDLTQLIESLPQKKMKQRIQPVDTSITNNTILRNKLLNLEVVSDTTEDSDIKPVNRKKQKPRNVRKSTVKNTTNNAIKRRTESTVKKNHKIEKSIQSSEISSTVKRSTRRTRTKSYETEHNKSEVRRNIVFSNDENDTEHTSSSNSEKKVVRKPTHNRINKKQDDVTSDVSSSVSRSRRKKQEPIYPLRFQTQLFEDSDSECLSVSRKTFQAR